MIVTQVPDMLALVGRLAHDVRNGLNGLELESSLLEVLHDDERTQESIRRMRRQGGEIEAALRHLLTRFSTPVVEVAPAIDVFSLWKSRSKSLPNSDSIEWSGDIGDLLISVDANMVANALCEALSYLKNAELSASVSQDGAEVLFEIARKADSPEKTIASVKEWPLWAEVIEQNGGRHEMSPPQAPEFFRRCWFPSRKPDFVQ